MKTKKPKKIQKICPNSLKFLFLRLFLDTQHPKQTILNRCVMKHHFFHVMTWSHPTDFQPFKTGGLEFRVCKILVGLYDKIPFQGQFAKSMQ